MDEGLFTKHLRTLQKRSEDKEEVTRIIFEATGIHVEESECILTGKVIQLTLSSAKKSTLFRKGVGDILKKAGYTLKA